MKHHRTLTYKLTSFNGTTLTGVTRDGITLSATIIPRTIYHVANLNQYIPTDPILPLVVTYNTAVRSGRSSTILNAVTQLANAGANVQVRLEPYSNIVTSFRPVPPII
ncbi:hypothetical protein IIQ_01705 [Bacillus cereus VD118]|uniref:Uncharacterized protein n=2 Tax=Bacillus cereus group TaxID=86661 RepID=R8QG65_BACCE|nr:hypothetical protein IIQ_01705 [Bacillus cereus VD118]SCB68591.1 Uncharacterized protein BWGO95_02733 [Bacillus mycoides]